MEDLTKQAHQYDLLSQIKRHTTQDTDMVGSLLLADIQPEYRNGFPEMIRLLNELSALTDSMMDTGLEKSRSAIQRFRDEGLHKTEPVHQGGETEGGRQQSR